MVLPVINYHINDDEAEPESSNFSNDEAENQFLDSILKPAFCSLHDEFPKNHPRQRIIALNSEPFQQFRQSDSLDTDIVSDCRTLHN
jgi:hypothetical protein